MTKKKINEVVDRLFALYPEPKCALDFTSPLELLVASRLSAQCTDKRVNIVTAELFKKYKTVSDYANAKNEDIEKIIFSCGLYKTKARDIILAAKKIEGLGGIPDTLEGLLEIPGIGRKIANLLMGEIFGDKNVLIADTHCIRLSNRIGLVSSKNPTVVEKTLLKILPKDTGFRFSHSLVAHGRAVCSAQSPNCEGCVLKGLCEQHLDYKKG